MKRHNQLMYLYIGVYVTSQYLKVLTHQYIIISITVIIIFRF